MQLNYKKKLFFSKKQGIHSILIICGFLVLITPAFSQSSNAPLDKDYYHIIDRFEIKNGKFSETFHSAIKPFERKSIAAFADSVILDSSASSEDIFNKSYLQTDNNEFSSAQITSAKPLLKRFYKTPAHLYEVNVKNFSMSLDPVLYFSVGKENQYDNNLYINTRGIAIRGMIGNKVGFYSYISENQMAFPQHVNDFINSNQVVPGFGFWKRFKENGVDFFDARGYISFNAAKVINIQFGQDKFFIGDGYRSLILSDFSNSYLFLKLNTRVWRFNYTNLFTEMRADAPGTPTGSSQGPYPKKYMVFHQLSLNLTKNLNIGFFEAVTFAGNDSASAPNFSLEYLNPIIFYRAVEQQGGSTDNSILGANIKWNFAQHFSLYGQWVFDEFLLKEIKAGNGWWGNKYAYQAGVKYIDAFGIKNLDLQAEYNSARPYTYTHKNLFTNYSHYRQPLAHPLGANFKELIGIVRYQPLKRLHITAKGMVEIHGKDTANSNWGGNILLPYTTRERQNQKDEGHFTGQGVKNTIMWGDVLISYQLKHNVFIDLQAIYRKSETDINNSNSLTGLLSFRWNIPYLRKEM